jgi:hypothetical protein
MVGRSLWRAKSLTTGFVLPVWKADEGREFKIAELGSVNFRAEWPPLGNEGPCE